MFAPCSPIPTGCSLSSSASPPVPTSRPRARPADQPIESRLDRLARADRRLVDAEQAEVITWAELDERRRYAPFTVAHAAGLLGMIANVDQTPGADFVLLRVRAVQHPSLERGLLAHAERFGPA